MRLHDYAAVASGSHFRELLAQQRLGHRQKGDFDLGPRVLPGAAVTRGSASLNCRVVLLRRFAEAGASRSCVPRREPGNEIVVLLPQAGKIVHLGCSGIVPATAGDDEEAGRERRRDGGTEGWRDGGTVRPNSLSVSPSLCLSVLGRRGRVPYGPFYPPAGELDNRRVAAEMVDLDLLHVLFAAAGEGGGDGAGNVTLDVAGGEEE